ncbi:hypothetical protein J6590_008548 [Homalodisca vitripennis]|nr:hypothetical protein J6590_008548 [Homalodisca vitripennis]
MCFLMSSIRKSFYPTIGFFAYYALRPLYEDCKERLHELEKQNEELKSNNMCKIHIKKISELEILNEELSQDKQNLQFEIDELRLAKADLELIRLSHDKLKVENEQHKNRLDELVETLCHLEDKANVKEDESISNRDCVLTEAYSQTDVQSLVPSSEACCQIDGVQSLVPSSEACCQTDDVQSLVPSSEDSSHDSCEKNKQCAYKVENAELKLQIVAHIEQIKQLEQKESNEKDIYVKLYQKGIQAAKLQDTEELENGQNQETEVSLIPDLLQRLRIKQEELDNIKDKDYISPDNLLSAKEAVSLWKLARKVCMPPCHYCCMFIVRLCTSAHFFPFSLGVRAIESGFRRIERDEQVGQITSRYLE